jgi:5-methylcytosine-specific restriction endonuclease McrA
MAAKVEVICENCGNSFLKFNSEIMKRPEQRHYCSKDCLHNHRRNNKELNPNWGGGKIILICKQCCCEYSIDKSKSNGSNFCSKECTNIAAIGRFSGVNNPNYRGSIKHIVCKQCNKEFTTYHRSTKFCSKDCASASYIKPKVKLICANCNIEFERQPSYLLVMKNRNHTKAFCCEGCRKEHHKKENSPNWIHDRSKLKLEDVSFRTSIDMKKWKVDVFTRDNYTCQLCKNRSGKENHVTLNAHHIVRIKDNKDLAHDIENGITLCEKCHKKTYGKEKTYEDTFRALRNGGSWDNIIKQLEGLS